MYGRQPGVKGELFVYVVGRNVLYSQAPTNLLYQLGTDAYHTHLVLFTS